MSGYVDNRGVNIQEGDHVAYNLSGQIALGEVVALKQRSVHRRPRMTYDVRLLHRAAGQFPGHVSRVNDALSMLVVPKGGDWV